jgi:hypothetical protein
MFAKGFAGRDYDPDVKYEHSEMQGFSPSEPESSSTLEVEPEAKELEYDLARGQEERRPNSEVWRDPWTWVEASEQSLKSFPIFFGILISFASFK